jgi:hypothetical protein
MSDRRAAWKQRDAQGLVVLNVVANETDLAEMLIACGLLPPATLHNPTPKEIGLAVAQLLAGMIAEHKAALEEDAGDVSPHGTLKFAFIKKQK